MFKVCIESSSGQWILFVPAKLRFFEGDTWMSFHVETCCNYFWKICPALTIEKIRMDQRRNVSAV